MSDQAARLRRAVGATPTPRGPIDRQGPVSIRPRREPEAGARAASAASAATIEARAHDAMTPVDVSDPGDALGAGRAGLAVDDAAPDPSVTSIAPAPDAADVQVRATRAAPPSPPAAVRPGPAAMSIAPGRPAAPVRAHLARATAIASGKGGVGKTSVAASLALALAGRGRATWLVDGDLGLGNVDVACGITPPWTLADVLRGRCELRDALVPVAPGLRALAAGSGIAGLAAMPAGARDRLLRLLAEAEAGADELVVDCGAGVGATVLGFAAAAQEVLVVATPEPASVVDAYGLVKCITARRPAARIALVVNQVEGPREAAAVHGRIDAVARAHLGRSLPLAGVIPRDEAVRRAARARRPVVLAEPASPAAEAIRRLAARLLMRAPGHAAPPSTIEAPAAALSDATGAAPAASPAQIDRDEPGFISRVAGWLTRR